MLQQLIDNKDVITLCEVLFQFKLTPKQAEIVRAMAYEEAERITIQAPTQYGKSITVALGVCLHKVFHSNTEYQLIASLNNKTERLRNYIAERHLMCPMLLSQLELGASGPDRLKSEVSKRRLTYRDGSSMMIHSAEGDAMRLMGFGGDYVLVEESGEIPAKVYKELIVRMVGGRPHAVIVEIGNPWNPNSHFAEHWNDPRTPEQGGWLKIYISDEDAVAEGRITREFIDEQKRTLPPMMYQVLYKPGFPDEAEDQLIRKEWFNAALERKMTLTTSKHKAGLDVAEFGIDETVLFTGETDGRNYKVTGTGTWNKQDTMQTVVKVKAKIHDNAEIIVDSTGVGSGVHARLKELGYNALAYKGGEGPERDSDKTLYSNKLAMGYWQLRCAFEQGRIDISALKAQPETLAKLQKQLMSITYELTSDGAGKIKIIKPEDKSPDVADALMLFVTDCAKKNIGFAAVSIGPDGSFDRSQFTEIRGFGEGVDKHGS